MEIKKKKNLKIVQNHSKNFNFKMSYSNILPIFDNKYNIINDSDFGGLILCENIISKEKFKFCIFLFKLILMFNNY